MPVRSVIVVAVTVALSGALALPAYADTPPTPALASNSITVELTNGGLFATVSDSAKTLAPATAPSLTHAADSVNYTVKLQDFAVGDARRGATTWAATVTISDLAVGTTSQAISATAVTLNSAAITAGIAGSSTPYLNQAVTPTAANVAKALAGTTVELGNNTYAWTQTLVVSVPSTALVGTYTGTITNSVA